MVRLLAKERRKNGIDSLGKWSDEKISQVLENLLPKTSENERAVLSDNYAYLADIYYVTADYKLSLTWLMEYLKIHPPSIRSLKLFGKLMISICLPGSILNRLKHILNIPQQGK